MAHVTYNVGTNDRWIVAGLDRKHMGGNAAAGLQIAVAQRGQYIAPQPK